MNSVLDLTFKLIHISIIVFVVTVPFTKTRLWPLDLVHLVGVVSLLTHWWTNSDACFLTLFESWIRNVPEQASFMHQIVSPIYNIPDKDLSVLVTTITWILGTMSASHLWNESQQIKHDICTAYQESSQITR